MTVTSRHRPHPTPRVISFEQVGDWKARVIYHHRVFRWTKWVNPKPTDPWEHDHCFLCTARIDEQKTPGHYGYAYLSENPDEWFWLCRSCFKVVQKPLNLERLSRDG